MNSLRIQFLLIATATNFPVNPAFGLALLPTRLPVSARPTASNAHSVDMEIAREIIKEDNEIREIEDDDQSSSDPVGKSGRKKIQKLPSFLEQVSAKEPPSVFEGSDGVLEKVWLPFEIQERSENRVTLIFKQKPKSNDVGRFNRVDLVLTQREFPTTFQDETWVAAVGTNNGRILSKSTLGNSSDERFLQLDVTDFVRQHLEAIFLSKHQLALSDLQIDLQLHGKDLTQKLPIYGTFDVQLDRPFLMFSYDDTSNEIWSGSRRKRDAIENIPANLEIITATNNTGNNEPISQGTPSHLCQRLTWLVDPSDVGWHSVVLPRKLELGLCTGQCPSPLQSDHFNFTLHSFFMDRFRLNRVNEVPSNFPLSNCVPIAYKSIRVWLEDEELTFIEKVVPNASVKQCGCR